MTAVCVSVAAGKPTTNCLTL